MTTRSRDEAVNNEHTSPETRLEAETKQADGTPLNRTIASTFSASAGKRVPSKTKSYNQISSRPSAKPTVSKLKLWKSMRDGMQRLHRLFLKTTAIIRRHDRFGSLIIIHYVGYSTLTPVNFFTRTPHLLLGGAIHDMGKLVAPTINWTLFHTMLDCYSGGKVVMIFDCGVDPNTTEWQWSRNHQAAEIVAAFAAREGEGSSLYRLTGILDGLLRRVRGQRCTVRDLCDMVVEHIP